MCHDTRNSAVRELKRAFPPCTMIWKGSSDLGGVSLQAWSGLSSLMRVFWYPDGRNRAGRKSVSSAAGGDVATDMFLGHLCPIDEYRVYGYMTSTRLKLIAVLEDMHDIREPDLKKVREQGGRP